jgi:ectoine hydroxylase-related dioxygenase (phytanoyl-CoA dioxygenase family)
VTAPTKSTLAREIGVFTAPDYDGLEPFFAEHGFAVMRGVYTDEDLRDLEVELERQQQRLLAGELPEVCGTVILDDPDAVIDGEAFAHYVCHVTEVSPITRTAAYHPALVDMTARLLGPEAWLLEDDRFGVVYQDARPGDQSGYSRIGWHSDAQSGPNLQVWPSVAFTIHIDPTSPRNGFLRIVPGSHLGGTDDMPLGFEHVTGEMAVYCERGDVLLHHSDLWHSAARATDDGDGAIRRHVRGGWYGGERLAPNHGVDDFVKNARR